MYPVQGPIKCTTGNQLGKVKLMNFSETLTLNCSCTVNESKLDGVSRVIDRKNNTYKISNRNFSCTFLEHL